MRHSPFVAPRVRQEDDCLIWTGYCNPKGYGEVRYEGRTVCTHILAFLLANGRRAAYDIIHSCGDKRCVNPNHLIDSPTRAHTRRLTQPEKDQIRALFMQRMSIRKIAKELSLDTRKVSAYLKELQEDVWT